MVSVARRPGSKKRKKKKRKSGNTAGRTMGWLRDLGFTVGKTEQWLAFAKIRRDLFGFADVVAMKEGTEGILAVQTTHENFLDEHKKLMRTMKTVKLWLRCSNRILLVGWNKFWNAKGTRKRWAPVVFDVVLLNNRVRFVKSVVE
jgi:hypothetical protein